MNWQLHQIDESMRLFIKARMQRIVRMEAKQQSWPFCSQIHPFLSPAAFSVAAGLSPGSVAKCSQRQPRKTLRWLRGTSSHSILERLPGSCYIPFTFQVLMDRSVLNPTSFLGSGNTGTTPLVPGIAVCPAQGQQQCFALVDL